MRFPKPKLVRFDLYCNSCKNKDTKETDIPCDMCLTITAREDTLEPEFYKEKENG